MFSWYKFVCPSNDNSDDWATLLRFLAGLFHAQVAARHLITRQRECMILPMVRSKPPPAAPPEEPVGLEDAVVDLTAEVKGLASQVEVLRIAIDDLRSELEFAIRNLPREPWVPTQPLVSMPKDPLAEPFPVNRTRREDVPANSTAPSNVSEPSAPPPVAATPPAALRKRRQKTAELF